MTSGSLILPSETTTLTSLTLVSKLSEEECTKLLYHLQLTMLFNLATQRFGFQACSCVVLCELNLTYVSYWNVRDIMSFLDLLISHHVDVVRNFNV